MNAYRIFFSQIRKLEIDQNATGNTRLKQDRFKLPLSSTKDNRGLYENNLFSTLTEIAYLLILLLILFPVQESFLFRSNVRFHRDVAHTFIFPTFKHIYHCRQCPGIKVYSRKSL